jgi:hypothetical protein
VSNDSGGRPQRSRSPGLSSSIDPISIATVEAFLGIEEPSSPRMPHGVLAGECPFAAVFHPSTRPAEASVLVARGRRGPRGATGCFLVLAA